MRNYAINRLASRQIYLFDYRSLLEELQGVQHFTDRCLNRLIDLREGKHAYRSGLSHVATKNSGYGVASIITEACPELNLKPLSSGAGIRLFSMPYATLRDCEAALISKANGSGRAETGTKDLECVKRLIRKPSPCDLDYFLDMQGLAGPAQDSLVRLYVRGHARRPAR